MFQLIVMPQGTEKVMIQLIDTPTKVYSIGAKLFLSKVPLEVLQNWALIQIMDTPQIFKNVQGLRKELFQLISSNWKQRVLAQYSDAQSRLKSFVRYMRRQKLCK